MSDVQTSAMPFEAFERDWLRRHKGSIVQRPRVSSWGLMFSIGLWGLIALGAALVSGAHSVPAILQTIPSVVPSPAREILALFGFTILELLIFAGALYRRDSRYAGWGLLLSMVGALAANVGSSVYASMEHGGDGLNLAVAVVLAVIAPLAAFLAGEMMHRQFEKHRATIDAAMAKYEAARKELDATINREYSKYLKAVKEEAEARRPKSIPLTSNGIPLENRNGNGYVVVPSASTLGHRKEPNASQKVREYLMENPDAANGNPLELAAILGVGKSTVYTVIGEFKQSRTNGHGHE